MKIVNMRRMENSKSLKAFFTLDIGPLLIKKCKLFVSESGEAWAKMPDEKYEDRNTGETKYAALVDIVGDGLKDQIASLALAEYRKG